MFRQECLHFHLLHFRSDAVVSGVAGNEPLFHCSLECAVQGEVDASDSGTTQTEVALTAALLYPAALHQVFVELLEITGGQLLQLDLSDAGDGVGFDD